MKKLARHSVQPARPPIPEEQDQPLTREALKRAIPASYRPQVTQEFTDTVNTCFSDPEMRIAFRENLLNYSAAMQAPNIGLLNYVNAVKYMSFKLMGFNNRESWIRTFPKRYSRMIERKAPADQLDKIVYNYTKSKAVTRIMEQTMIPTWVLNQDVYQEAINTQATLMATARSEKVRSDAANSLLTHLKQPETSKFSIDVNVSQDDSIKDLREAAMELVREQRLMLESGHKNAKEVAESQIINGESIRS